jgi:dTDP-4-amino-4,6-dideoxygalactose transaminase
LINSDAGSAAIWKDRLITTMRKSYLVFGQPLIQEAEIDEVVKSMRAAWLGTGPKVAQFEKLIADYKQSPHAVAVGSCTAGLHLACLAIGLGPGDEVIVPAMTFCATVNTIIHAGATPVLVDVERDTFNIDPDHIRRAINPRTKGIMPVHFAGRACKMDEIGAIAEQHGLKVIEDCAHAVETEYRGRKAGTLGECGVLSFYSTKNVVTGEGGMVLTADAEIAARIRILALHGLSLDAWKRFSSGGYNHYQVVDIGFKYNMMDLQAAIGMHQIQRVDANWRKRLAIWDRYNRGFAGLPLGLPAEFEPNTRHGLHLYTILVDERKVGLTRDEFLIALHNRNIGSGVHYLSIPHHQIYQQRYGWNPQDYPVADEIGRQTLSLPLSAKLDDQDVDDVIAAVREIILQRN